MVLKSAKRWSPPVISKPRSTIQVLILMAVLIPYWYFTSPLYWVSEAVYWEALAQSRSEQNAIRHVILNRK